MEEKYNFSTELDVRIDEINYGGHLGNDKYLSFFQEARLRYLKKFDCSELSIGDETSLIMSQAHVNYKSEVFWGDRLKIFVRISQLEKIRFRIEYKIMGHGAYQTEVANGFTDMVGFDYKNRKIKRLPEAFVVKIKEFENIQSGI